MEYMSQEGYDELVAELRQMETVELPRVRDAIAEARDKGDLSENFEYGAYSGAYGLSKRCWSMRASSTSRGCKPTAWAY